MLSLPHFSVRRGGIRYGHLSQCEGSPCGCTPELVAAEQEVYRQTRAQLAAAYDAALEQELDAMSPEELRGYAKRALETEASTREYLNDDRLT